jgi:hypothetical protein
MYAGRHGHHFPGSNIYLHTHFIGRRHDRQPFSLHRQSRV